MSQFSHDFIRPIYSDFFWTRLVILFPDPSHQNGQNQGPDDIEYESTNPKDGMSGR